MRILVVDDDVRRHETIGGGLRARGHEVVSAYNYQQACQALEQQQFHGVYLDHDLGDFSGSGMYGGSELTGRDVARFITRLPAERLPAEAIVHSSQALGSYGPTTMVSLLQSVGIPAVHVPFREENLASYFRDENPVGD
jgi:CheY-like chemotaxis protein